ncbi:TIGR01459 family HAD-type hydrolase [Phenylobacterium sp.]|uniref:TIGR01459 family HAD-type hydrolase n=1 Tax=Phenylobacterium sp. TaxID=1871053 RepID=UPI00273178C7|nr:TIGR01459 family HAD-type hydrolase [Phenylobacterium sp.]MDP1617771.1 TIGR01459 family HAD-type hydrolase [Phenylobacterium sp.]MDP1988950.1 TIGR01459 family HAD-type hydrolase [Phenylobacterium sp.]
MTAPQTPQGLSDLTDHYDVLLSDVWGVIHNGRESFPQACAALARWRAERGPVILISNSPRPSADVVAQLDALGVPREAWSAFVTSGDATRLLLAERAPGPAWRLGPDRDAPLYEGLGLSFESLDKAAFIACTGPIDDETEGPGDYQERFEGAAARGLEMVCANPDIVVQRGDRLIYCGGALAQLYEALGGTVVMAGKPHAPIYELCVAEAERLTGGPVARSRMLCIGDGVATDVKGANAQGLDVMFIAAGIHGAETITPHGLDAAAVEALLRKEGAHARFAMADLAW